MAKFKAGDKVKIANPLQGIVVEVIPLHPNTPELQLYWVSNGGRTFIAKEEELEAGGN